MTAGEVCDDKNSERTDAGYADFYGRNSVRIHKNADKQNRNSPERRTT